MKITLKMQIKKTNSICQDANKKTKERAIYKY